MNQSIKSSVTAGMLALAILATAAPTPSAYAQTTTAADLEAQIQVLMAQIQKLQSQQVGQSSVSISLTRDLREGMSGADVKALQQFLNANADTAVAVSGIGSKGNETLYFGPATKAAVIKFQNKYKTQILTPSGLTQGTGFVGAATRAHINTLGQTTTPVVTTPKPNTPATPSSPIVQEEGDISVTRGSEHTNTLELTGDFDEIYSVQVKADDSAMTINRMDFMFDKKVWRYIDSFRLYQDGEKIADVKATEDNFSEVGDEYRLRFSGLNAMVKKNDKDTFVLEAKALASVSGTRQEDTLTVYMPTSGIRALDTAKLTTNEPAQNLAPRTFNFRDAEDDGEIVVSLDGSSPESNIVQVKSKTNLTNETVMIASIKADDSNIEVEDVYVKVESSEATVANVVRTLSLVFDGKTVAQESVLRNSGNAINGTDEEGNAYTIIESGEYYVHFDHLKDIEIDEGAREKLTIKAEFYKQSGRYSNGTDVTFTLRAVEGENVHGKTIKNGDLTTGNNRVFSLYTEGLTFKMVSQEAKSDGKLSQSGLFTLTFDVSAFGDSMYVPVSADRQIGTTTNGTVGAEYSVINGNDERYALGSAYDALLIKGAKQSDGYFRLNEGSTYRVTVDVTLNNTGAVASYYRTALEAFRFKVGSITGTEYTITSGLGDFETKALSVKN